MHTTQSRLDRWLWRITYRALFERVATHWRWPEHGGRPEAWEAVRFDGSGGTLAGLWGAAHGPARGTIVLAPPTSKKAKGYFLDFGHGRFLRNAGYDVFMFDFNGFGESENFSFQYPLDVLAAGREAQRRAPDQPVGLLGVCFGAVYGICAMTRPDHPFTAAVLESPYASVDGILEAMGRHGRSRRFFLGRRLLMRLLMPLRPEMRALSQMPRVRGLEAALFVSGERDDYVPTATVARFVEACRTADAPAAACCDLWEVEGAEHLKTVHPDPGAYARRIAGFFDAAFADAAREVPAEAARCTGERIAA